MRSWNARVVDPGSGKVLERATIGIEGDRITNVAGATGDAPVGAIDLEGRAILPGFIDAHTHLASDTSRAPGLGHRPSCTARSRGRARSATFCSHGPAARSSRVVSRRCAT